MTATASRARGSRPSLFQATLALSLAAHLLLFGALERKPPPAPQDEVKPDVIDVDLRTPYLPRNPKDTRLPGSIPKAPAPMTFKRAPFPLPLPKEQVAPAKKAAQAEGEGPPTKEAPKPWVLPNRNTKVLEKPTLASAPAAQLPAFTAPGGAGPGGQNGRGGWGGGPGTGGAWINRPPRLINRDEVMASLKRLYPEVERRSGREGKVVIRIEIGVDGLVHDVDVVDSAGENFDDAARSVAKIMRFEPELKASIPVVSRRKLPVYFQLTND